MRDTTIARNYAETLLVLAGRAGDLRGWGRMITDVADAMNTNPKLRLFLESPRVAATKKNEVLGAAFQDRMPRLMVPGRARDIRAGPRECFGRGGPRPHRPWLPAPSVAALAATGGTQR